MATESLSAEITRIMSPAEGAAAGDRRYRICIDAVGRICLSCGLALNKLIFPLSYITIEVYPSITVIRFIFGVQS